jgi:phosphatidylserine decarboxylase
MTNFLRAAVKHAVPQHALTALVRSLARCANPRISGFLIHSFCRLFPVDLREAADPDPAAYPTFNAFFTRALRAEARPVDPEPAAVVSPVDGFVSQVGNVEDGCLMQAKGRSYSVAALLGSEADAARFAGGSFITLYLAPHNYHRIHAPCDVRLQHMRYIPGRLFSVNEASVAAIDRLFARNERVVCSFEGPGRMVLCMVGALFVGSMETVWHGAVTPAADRRVTEWDYSAATRSFVKGDDLAHFNMGSTVILLFEQGSVTWDNALVPGVEVRRIGKLQ